MTFWNSVEIAGEKLCIPHKKIVELPVVHPASKFVPTHDSLQDRVNSNGFLWEIVHKAAPSVL